MKITEKYVNESHIDEVANLIQIEKSLIVIDYADVESVLLGKEGVLYQAFQDEGVENSTFLKEFFCELKKKNLEKSCTSLLLSIGMSPDKPLTMEEVDIVNDFFDSLDIDKVDARWGIKNNEEGSRMSILLICTKETI